MPCPFCLIASGIQPSAQPATVHSPMGSAYPVLSTPHVVAFLDIAPVSSGHLLICPREHRDKITDLTALESAAIGFWLPVLSRAVMRAAGAGTEGSWNVLQANGSAAGQTVPHSHFHIIPRQAAADADGTMTDEERRNLVLGEGPRAKLEADEGERLSALIKTEVSSEMENLSGEGVVGLGDGPGEVWAVIPNGGLKL
ncbi:HIT-like domain-containing protein [Plectosphaerella plurivora]|uniref:HIT-like domain-containing protein n=1 Tax=Plectosphaerella plurivora TaxID=936078 RepID=A0A9P8V7V0_9PEZI|nr:HIT-like domain-containing protein [Plectosphaerella plurivora]